MSLPPVAIVHGRVTASAAVDEKDVLVQADAVRSALRALGHRTVDVPLTLDLEEAAKVLRAQRPLIAFNLAETIDGRGSMIHLAPMLLDSLGIPYTGAPCEAILLTSHKLLAKKILHAAGVDTPPWTPAADSLSAAPAFPPPWIVKSVWEHASVGLEDGSVAATHAALADEISRRTRTERIEHLFVEGYIEGREFNLALLGGTSDGEPESLPPAEIQFLGYPVGKPKMVGYKAKWDEGSFEYNNTPRRFDFPPGDDGLIGALLSVSRKCWKAFELRGYARVDFRVDGPGRPWVLEINTNPCISPDAGFMAAAGRAGLSMEDVVRRIVAEATMAAAAAAKCGRTCREENEA
ncbi:MAG: D-alanine--D-alanine ligase [Spirochaetia bacterium]|jgi:D-alanine-D-alanine ligase